VKLIHRRFGVDERTAQRWVNEWRERGLVSVTQSPKMITITAEGQRFCTGFRKGRDAIDAIIGRTPTNALHQRRDSAGRTDGEKPT
jgi:hypothetical protein